MPPKPRQRPTRCSPRDPELRYRRDGGLVHYPGTGPNARRKMQSTSNWSGKNTATPDIRKAMKAARLNAVWCIPVRSCSCASIACVRVVCMSRQIGVKNYGLSFLPFGPGKLSPLQGPMQLQLALSVVVFSGFWTLFDMSSTSGYVFTILSGNWAHILGHDSQADLDIQFVIS